MKPEQKYIYYGCGETVERILSLPQAEALQDKGFEMLCLTDNVDEFALRVLGKYDEKEFRNISADDLGLETAEEQEKTKELAQENQEMLTFMKESLGDKVADVRVSGKLKSHPVCITTDGMISTEMEKVLHFRARPGRRSKPSGCWKSTGSTPFSRGCATCMRAIRTA